MECDEKIPQESLCRVIVFPKILINLLTHTTISFESIDGLEKYIKLVANEVGFSQNNSQVL